MQFLPGLSFFLLQLLSTTYAQFRGSPIIIVNPKPLPGLPSLPPGLQINATAIAITSSSFAARKTEVALQNDIGISAGQPNYSRSDPCGPAEQAANSVSTCTGSVSISADTNQTLPPSSYGVSCRHCNDSEGHRVPNITTCKNEMILICQKLAAVEGYPPPTTDQWVWGNAGGNCALGFWLPGAAGAAPPPSFKRCVSQIFGFIANTCLEPKWNVGSVNLKELPDMQAFNDSAAEGSYFTGMAVDGGYPSYIMLAQQSPEYPDAYH